MADDSIVIGADHPAQTQTFRIAPKDAAPNSRLRIDLQTVACFQISAPGFDLDSSFLVPEMRGELGTLAELLVRHPEAPLSVFGHADPSGRDERNKALSGRRAAAVYALLVRRVDIWEQLFKSQVEGAGDDWSYRHIQIMLQSVDRPDGGPYYDGPIDGKEGDDSKEAVSDFQTDNDLGIDGDAGPETRKVLFEAYMDHLCTPTDGGAPFDVDPAFFLGASEDEKGKADFQGCGEFNPFLVFSKAEAEQLRGGANQAARAAENALNRRVLILFFAPGTHVPPAEWPCPRASEGSAGCRRRFFHKGDERRQPAEERRTFDGSRDTFACRFYQRLVFHSPCERPTSAPRSYDFVLQEPRDTLKEAESLRLRSDDGSFDQVLTPSDGLVSAQGLLMRFTLVRPNKKYTLIHNPGEDGGLTIFADVPIDQITDFGNVTEAPVLRDPVPPSEPRTPDPPSPDPVLANADEEPLEDAPDFHEPDPFEDGDASEEEEA